MELMNGRFQISMSHAPRQEVLCLPLPPHLRQKLMAAGFRTRGDLEGVDPVHISRGW